MKTLICWRSHRRHLMVPEFKSRHSYLNYTILKGFISIFILRTFIYNFLVILQKVCFLQFPCYSVVTLYLVKYIFLMHILRKTILHIIFSHYSNFCIDDGRWSSGFTSYWRAIASKEMKVILSESVATPTWRIIEWMIPHSGTYRQN